MELKQGQVVDHALGGEGFVFLAHDGPEYCWVLRAGRDVLLVPKGLLSPTGRTSGLKIHDIGRVGCKQLFIIDGRLFGGSFEPRSREQTEALLRNLAAALGHRVSATGQDPVW